jgi:hypothetical protein
MKAAARSERLPLHAGVFLSYAVVAIVYTFPLIGHLTTEFPNFGTDVYGFIWNNWWIHYAVTELHARPYFTDYVFAPFTVDLRLHTLGLLYGLLSIPFMSFLGPVGILNGQIIATIVLNGYSTFKLTAALTKSDAAGIISGLVVAATPAINFHLTVGRPSCAAVWPAIVAMLAFLRFVDRPDCRRAAWLAVSLTAVMMADQQAALFGAGWLAVLLGYFLITRRQDVVNRRFLAAGAVVVAIVLIPAYVLYWRPFARTAGYTVPGAIEAFRYSYPLRLLWTPSMVWRVYGVVMPIGLVASVAFIRRVPSAVPWVLGSILFVALSLGPVVMGTKVPLPFSLVQALPGLAQFRTPYRFQIPAAIGLAVIIGILVSQALESSSPTSRRRLLTGVAVLVVGDLLAYRIAAGFAIGTLPREAVYEEIGRDNRNCVILEIPLGVRTGTDRIGPGEALTFYQPVHRKRLVNGFVARGPLAALYYYRESPSLMFLANEIPPAGDIASDLRRRLRELDVCYVVIHTELMDKAWREQTLALFSRVDGLRRLEARTGITAFRVDNYLFSP